MGVASPVTMASAQREHTSKPGAGSAPGRRRAAKSSGASRGPVGRLGDIPKLVAELHPTKNHAPKRELRELSLGSDRVLWWRCAKGPDHEWHAIVWYRRQRGLECPFCAGHRLSVTNALATLATRRRTARSRHSTSSRARAVACSGGARRGLITSGRRPSLNGSPGGDVLSAETEGSR